VHLKASAGTLGLPLSLALALAPALALAADWEQVFEDQGIKVWRQEVPGSDVVAFRGRGPVDAPILQVAAVIRDADREEEWMENCGDAFTVAFRPNAIDAVIYNRTDSPFFLVSDRDTVLFSKTTVRAADKTILVEFSAVEDKRVPPKPGAVRMPTLEGHWKLRQLGVHRTEVEYQVLADPGGSLPKWVVNMVQKKLPFHTLVGLRRQVAKAGYEKHREILATAIDWSGFQMPERDATIGPGQSPAAP
jgi:hypothetical protein